MSTVSTQPGGRMPFESRREQLLRIGTDLFRDSDYAEVWIEEVARRAGISRGLLYHYFPTKRAYFLAVVERNASLMRVPDDLEPGLTVEQQVRDNLHRYLDLVAPRSNAYLAAHRLRRSDPEIGALVDRHLRAQEERTLARVMAGLGSPGEPAPEPVRLAVHGWIECMVMQVITWLEAAPDDRMPREAVVELLARGLESALLHAVEVIGQPAPPAVAPVAVSHTDGLDVTCRMTPEARREHLLAVGADLFAHADYDEVWIDRVAERAGTSRGLLYHYFTTKRDFYLAVLRYRSDRLLAAADARIDALPREQMMRAALRNFLEHVRSGPLTYRDALARRYEDPAVGAMVEVTRRQLEEQMLGRMMASAGLTGPPPQPVVLVTRGWLAFLTTLAVSWLDGGTTPSGSLVEMLARTFEDMRATALDLAAGPQSKPSPNAASTSDGA